MSDSKQTVQMWVLLDKRGSIVLWAGALSTRRKMMHVAAHGCIGAIDYHQLATDSARWRIARRYGYRIVKATLALESP